VVAMRLQNEVRLGMKLQILFEAVCDIEDTLLLAWNQAALRIRRGGYVVGEVRAVQCEPLRQSGFAHCGASGLDKPYDVYAGGFRV